MLSCCRISRPLPCWVDCLACQHILSHAPDSHALRLCSCGQWCALRCGHLHPLRRPTLVCRPDPDHPDPSTTICILSPCANACSSSPKTSTSRHTPKESGKLETNHPSASTTLPHEVSKVRPGGPVSRLQPSLKQTTHELLPNLLQHAHQPGQARVATRPGCGTVCCCCLPAGCQ
jgi:hypothetical protein